MTKTSTINEAVQAALTEWHSQQNTNFNDPVAANAFIAECRQQIEWLADEAVMEWAEGYGVDASRDSAY